MGPDHKIGCVNRPVFFGVMIGIGTGMSAVTNSANAHTRMLTLNFVNEDLQTSVNIPVNH
jgi:hypothetical protein